MFRQAVFRLTFWYALVILLLSVIFSAALYTVSTRELNSLQHRQENLLRSDAAVAMPHAWAKLNQQRIEQIEDAKRHIALRLIYFNLVILILGTLAAYFLAKRTLEPIEEAVEAQDRFTADASHELRTPLTAMRTELEVALRDTKLSLAESKALHKSTLQEIAKLEGLTNGLLTLAKHNNDTVSFQPVPLREVVEGAVERVAVTAKQRKISIETEVGEGTVMGDRWALVELCTILLDNALKYSAGGKTVWVTAKTSSRQALIVVKDQGSGIKSSDLPYIFNRFYRADRSRTKERVDGYGLGLSIAKKIAEAHQGTIQVSSKPGVGTSFMVHLPLAPVE